MIPKLISAPVPPPPDLSCIGSAVLEHSPLPMALLEGVGHIVRQINSACCRLLEKEMHCLLGKSFGSVLPEPGHWVEALDRVYRTGQPESHTEEQLFERPAVFWTYTMWPVMAQDQPVGIVVQVTVTTKRQERTVAMNEALVLGSVHQHELTEAGNRLNALLREEIAERTKVQQALAEKARLLDLSNDAIVVLDCDHRIQYWNQGAMELYGWSREEALGKISYDLLHTVFLQPIEQITEELLRTNRWTGELIHTKRGGSRVSVLVRKVMDRDTQGNAVAIMEYMTDITGRKHAEESLRMSEERYRSLFNSIDEGFCIIEMLFDENAKPVDYRFLETNPAFEKQSGLHGASGKRMLELSPGHEPHWFNVYGTVALTGESVRFESEAKAMNRWFDVYAFRLDEPERRKVAVLFTDVSERKRSEAILRESREKIENYAGDLQKVVGVRTAELTASNQQLEAIVYSMAHDLRAPLRSMQGFSAMLVDEASTALSASGQDYAHRIDQSAQFMDALLSDLLAYTRTSQQHVELTAVNLERVVGSVLSRMQKEIGDMNACVECSGPWPEVRAHEPTLIQILSQLTSNALKFVRPDVPLQVKLWAEEQTDCIRIWVEDNGLGIAPDYQKQIFRLFIRLDRGKYRGTGAGLAIVQKGIERMGGRVGVKSTLGQGSQFWIELAKAVPAERGGHHVD